MFKFNNTHNADYNNKLLENYCYVTAGFKTNSLSLPDFSWKIGDGFYSDKRKRKVVHVIKTTTFNKKVMPCVQLRK